MLSQRCCPSGGLSSKAICIAPGAGAASGCDWVVVVPLLATAHRCKKARFYSAHPKQHHPTALWAAQRALGPPLAGRTCSRHAGGGGQHRRNAFVARRRALLPGRIRAERACGATGKTTFEDSYDRGGGAVPTMWAGGVACLSGPSRPVSGGRAATFHAARQPKRSIDLQHSLPPRCPAAMVSIAHTNFAK